MICPSLLPQETNEISSSIFQQQYLYLAEDILWAVVLCGREGDLLSISLLFLAPLSL